MPRLFALFLIATTAFANESSYRSLQSGSAFGGTPLHDRGIHGQGQIIAVLDTGADYENCFLAETNGALPPINTGSPQGGYEWSNVDLNRRKIIAYDFLYSCDQYPNATGCDDPSNANAWDNQGHGTHAAAAAAGDRGTALAHDYADALAPAAKLVIQDAGFIGGDRCSQRPGIGCPVVLTPILDQAYRQGARIHSNSWGDRQGVPAPLPPPTANYSSAARDVDAFVWSHPDMLVVFNTGNYSASAVAPPSSLSSPGSAKNTLQVGGTRTVLRGDDTITDFTLVGPTRDGRIKPDLVAPAYVVAGDARIVTGGTCGYTTQPGTSWSSPTVAGAAALVRQYYTDGFYPSGVASPSNRFIPTAALLKATLIASARAVPFRGVPTGYVAADPPPNGEQGFGFPVLDDALYFPGDRSRLRVVESNLGAGETSTLRLSVRSGVAMRAVLVWTDPPGNVGNDTEPKLVNDLDLRVVAPDGSVVLGNGTVDRLNNVESVSIAAPQDGLYTIEVSLHRLGLGPRQDFALVITGDLSGPKSRSRAVRP